MMNPEPTYTARQVIDAYRKFLRDSNSKKRLRGCDYEAIGKLITCMALQDTQKQESK